MNQLDGECQYAQTNESIMKDFYGNLLKGFNTEIGSMEINKYCKFKLKENRKFQNQNTLKRLRVLRKNKNCIFNLNTDLQQNLPPKAPENRTQYLSSIQKNFGISENRKIRFEKLSQGLFQENGKNLSSNSQNSNSNEKIDSIAKKTAKFCEKITQNLSLNEVKEKRNSKKSENFTVAEKENIIPTFANKKKSIGNNANYATFPLRTIKDLENKQFEQKEDLENYNYLDLDFYDEEFLTGSTMKSIVESITKSKNKILSNSLNLDGNESNAYLLGNRTNENGSSDLLEKEMIQNDFHEMNFKITDFIPEMKEIDLEAYSQDAEYNNFFVNNTNSFTNNGIFHFNLNNLNYEFSDNNSTKNTSNNNSPSEIRSPASSCNLEENQNCFFSNENKENKNPTNDENINSDNSKEKLQFFLLGNKKNREPFDYCYNYENKENKKNNFYYDNKKS